jgi:hypothetical protein
MHHDGFAILAEEAPLSIDRPTTINMVRHQKAIAYGCSRWGSSLEPNATTNHGRGTKRWKNYLRAVCHFVFRMAWFWGQNKYG